MADGTEGSSSPERTVDPTFVALLEKLSSTYGFDFREYKDVSLVRRVRARMTQVHVETFSDYSHYLDQHKDEHVALFNAILINVTGFFRDPDAWQVVGAEIIPRIVDEASSSRSIRIWSVGCSSGEEPYTIAMLLAEHLGNRASEYLVKIYGTDIDENALATARHAAYRTEQLKEVPNELLERYFSRDGHMFRLRRELRQWCIFGVHNIIQAPPLSHLDLLTSRNLMIYFRSELQDRLVARFHYALREGGYLFLGRSESLLARSRLFSPLNTKWRIFQRSPGGLAAVQAPANEHAESGGPVVRSERAVIATWVQRAMEALPAATLIVDMTDTIVGWNPAAERLFDVPVTSAIGRKFRDLDVSYRVEGLRSRIEDVKARHAVAQTEEATFSRRTGEIVHADFFVAPLVDAQRMIGVIVFAQDATEQVRLREQMSRIAEQHATAIEELQSTNEELETTNEELQSTNEELETTNEELQSTNEELEATVQEFQALNAELATLNAQLESRTSELNRLDSLHRALLDSLDQGVIVTDRDVVVEAWNVQTERMLRIPAGQAVGRDLFALPIGDVTRARPVIQRVLTTGQPEVVDGLSYVSADGESRRLGLRIAPMRSADGRIIGVTNVLVTEASPITIT
jgi:two-component system, chemotaxis family, CheB/CheR fusion protein